jgi:hypothetical protein
MIDVSSNKSQPDAPKSRLTTRRGRQVILRQLPPDCLLEGQLYPSIRERLERIRQIPHAAVGALLGVESDSDGIVWLEWEWIDGQPFTDAASDPARSTRQVASLMRELALEVEAFHNAGLVHGALDDSSVLVDRLGKIRLTCASPLLHHDIAVDELAVMTMLQEVVDRRNEQESSLGQLIARARSENWALRAVRMELAGELDSNEPSPAFGNAPRAESRLRTGALLAATIVAIVGAVTSLAIYLTVRRAQPSPPTPPILRAPH